MDSSTTVNKPVILILLIAIAIAAMIIAGKVIKGNTYVSLHSAPALSGQISQSLITPNGKSVTIPSFTLQNVRYFFNGNWVVVEINMSGSKSTVILEKANITYQVVLGPGTIFPTSAVYGMPSDVSSYLYSKDLVSLP